MSKNEHSESKFCYPVLWIQIYHVYTMKALMKKTKFMKIKAPRKKFKMPYNKLILINLDPSVFTGKY